MSFKIDRQTFIDLNIFPERKGDYSIFEYFNYTKSYKGKDKLLDFMKNPINDISVLKDRLDALKYLKESFFEFETDAQDLDFIEYYLNNNTSVLRDNIFDSFLNWVGNKIKPRNEYYVITRGLEKLKEHLIYLEQNFINKKQISLPKYLKNYLTELKFIFEKKPIKQILNNKKKNLSFRQVNHYDYLMRRVEKESIKRILNFTYEIDALLSITEAAKINKLAFPVFLESNTPSLKIDELFHPFLDNPITNCFTLGENNNLSFLTGANMSGKSTFLKGVGLCVYLSHIGFPVPAKAMESTIFNGLLSTINIVDNINKGYSHYYSEVKRVKETALLIKENEKVVVIFDELFRGTNVKDAYDASLMIISAFSKINTCLFLVSTHIVEIAEELKQYENISFRYFESSLNGEEPVYNYKLKNGVSSERLGLQIVKNEKILEILEGKF